MQIGRRLSSDINEPSRIVTFYTKSPPPPLYLNMTTHRLDPISLDEKDKRPYGIQHLYYTRGFYFNLLHRHCEAQDAVAAAEAARKGI